MMRPLSAERHDEVLGTGLSVLVFRVAESQACQRFEPELEAFADDRPDVAVWTVEAMQQRDLAERHGLRALPTIVIYRDGLPCRRFAGGLPADDLADAVAEVAAADMADEHNDWMLSMIETGEAGSPLVGAGNPELAPASPADEGTFPGVTFSPIRQTSRFTTAAQPFGAMTAARPLGAMSESTPAMRATAPLGCRTDPNRDALLESAHIAWYGGDVPAAIRRLTAVIESGPTAEILNSRGQVLADNGGGELALADLDQALAQTPDSISAAYARSARALALAQVGRHDEADREMARALAETPNNAWAHLRQARIQMLRGDRAGMLASLSAALGAQEPPLTDTQRALAESLQLLGFER